MRPKKKEETQILLQPRCWTKEIESKPLKDIIPVCGFTKLEKSFEDVPLLDEESNDYIIINFEILKQFWCRFVIACSEQLSKNIEYGDGLSCHMGYAHKIYIVCGYCSYKEYIYITTITKRVKTQERRKYDSNIRTVAFREI